MQSEEKNSPLQQLHALLVEIRQAPGNEQLHWKCHRLLKDLATHSHPVLATYQPVIYELLLILFCNNAVSHQTLALMSVQQLKVKYGIGAETKPAQDESLLFCLAF